MKAIETDGGTDFRNKLMAELCQLLHTKHIFSSPMNPASNSNDERQNRNRNLNTYLRTVCTSQDEWAQHVLFSYRASVAIPLGISPFNALFGRVMEVGLDLALLKEYESSPTTQTSTSDLISKIKLTEEVIQQNMKDSADRSKKI